MDEPDRTTTCSLCSQLSPRKWAHQKYGWEGEDTFLPAAAERLVLVRDFKPHSERKLQWQHCPECGTYYEYKTDYEYLVNGSEDEQCLTRLTDEAAQALLAG